MWACGPRAYTGRVRAGLWAHYPDPPRVFSAGLRAEPAGQALIAIPIFKDALSFQHILEISVTLITN